jgi:tRNA (cytidine/uridine-2'-O-)-methyltransferase
MEPGETHNPLGREIESRDSRSGWQGLENGLHVVLFEPEIAANTGAIGRTCVAVGATLWLVRPLGFHLSDRYLRRAGLDYWRHLTWRAVDSLDDVSSILGRERMWAFSAHTAMAYTDAQFRSGDALVFGSERRGLPKTWISERPDHALRIPIRPEARCLNLANAVAVATFEALRQLNLADSGDGTQGKPFVV